MIEKVFRKKNFVSIKTKKFFRKINFVTTTFVLIKAKKFFRKMSFATKILVDLTTIFDELTKIFFKSKTF